MTYPVDSCHKRIAVAFSEHSVGNIVQQTFDEVRRGNPLLKQTIFDEPAAHVFQDAHHWLKPRFRRLVLRCAVFRMLFWIVGDKLTVGVEEADSGVVART